MNAKHESFLDLVIYQIYPRSFNDSNGDGIGDIAGITEKLDYLCELGINAVWLCPCYKSPNHDNGYDVADYRDIMDEFGTMDDMKNLISEMHKRGMKLIMDLVPNHTSNGHKWFLESKKSKDNPYSDYYYWYDEIPNNWGSIFGGSAWEYVPERNQYYLHSYTVEQPDLNWDNPKVVKDMQDVIDFWVDLGVDGFRVDVIDQISKEIVGGNNYFGPHLHEYIHAMFGREKTKEIFTVGECWAGEIEEIKRHIGEDRGELSTLFQFDHIYCGTKDGKFGKAPTSLKEYCKTVIKWQLLNQENDILHSVFTDNHDNNYLLSRVGNDKELRYESATCIAAIMYLMKGVLFIYEGQEFGCAGSHFDNIKYFDDIESINKYNELLSLGKTEKEALEVINFGGRDNARRPMAWDSSEKFGFTSGTPWIPFGSRSKEINLESDLKSDKSVWRFYRDLLKLRKEYVSLRKGEFKVISDDSDSYLVYTRTYGDEKFTVVCNFEESSVIDGKYLTGEKVLTNCKDNTADTFSPYEIAVYKNF